MSDTSRSVSVSRVIPAEPSQIFAVLTDPALHPVIDGSETVKSTLGSPPATLTMGSKFRMRMWRGLPYLIRNTVVEYEPNQLIAWRHFYGHRWRYELEPADGGTRVTETFDWSTARSPGSIERMGYPEKHPPDMERTLERLEARLGSDP